jgi:hypothetical protein
LAYLAKYKGIFLDFLANTPQLNPVKRKFQSICIRFNRAEEHFNMRTDPIFIVEDACSGAHDLAALLSKHPDIGITPEGSFVIDLMYHFRNRVLIDHGDIDEVLKVIFQSCKPLELKTNEFNDFEMDPVQLKSCIGSGLPTTFPDIVSAILKHYCRKHFPGSSAWCIKSGRYVFELDKLIRYFPKAKFIHVIRDGRAVYASRKRSFLKQAEQLPEADPGQAAKQWNRVTQCFSAFQQLYPQNALEISHESLVQQQHATQSKVFRFLEVPDLDITVSSRTISKPLESLDPLTQSDLVRYPPQVDAWKKELSPLEIYLYETVAGHSLKHRGYDLVAQQHIQRPALQPASTKVLLPQVPKRRFTFSLFQAISNRFT